MEIKERPIKLDKMSWDLVGFEKWCNNQFDLYHAKKCEYCGETDNIHNNTCERCAVTHLR